MRSKLLQVTRLLVISTLMIPSSLLVAAVPTAGEQTNRSEEQKYVGLWVGSYTTGAGVTEKLSYLLKKDEKGQWQGTVKFTNEDGEQTVEFKALQIADGKMKGKMEDPNGEVEITIEGQFKGDQLEGLFSVSPKGTTDVADKGTWKVTRSAAAKSGQ